jgi:hypothetical protein
VDLIGKRFGRLVVISEGERIGPRKNNPYGFPTWMCRCDCGKIICKRQGQLSSDRTKSCGCLRSGCFKKLNKKRLLDLTGQVFGKLTIIGSGDRVSGFTAWKCRCQCGNIKNIRTNSLRKGTTISCGCAKKEYKSGKIESCLVGKRFSKYVGSIPSAYFNDLKKNAKSRNLDFNLSPESLDFLYKKQKGKCAISGLNIAFDVDINQSNTYPASLDRINSSVGYVDGNIQWVAREVNHMKWSLKEEDFLFFCEAIVRHKMLLDKILKGQ